MKKKAYVRESNQIHDLEEGKEVVLYFANGEEYTGIFKGIDDDLIMLKSLDSEMMIGLPLNGLKCFLERFK